MQEITPDRYRCGFVAECPAAFRLEDGRILLIGKKAEFPLLEKIWAELAPTSMRWW